MAIPETPQDYRDASQRHIDTCIQLMASYNSLTNITIKESLLINTYYLTGYILECIFTYTICDLIGYSLTGNVRQIKDTCYSVSFRRDYSFKYNLEVHDLDMKAEFIQKNGGDKIDNIPIIGQNPNVSKECKELHNLWKPGLRYKCKHHLSMLYVNELVNVSSEIQKKLLIQNP